MALQIDPAELIRRVLDSRVQDVWTSFPAKVLAYDSATQTIELEPVVRRPVPVGDDGDTETEPLPVIPNVPVQFPRGAGDSVAITWPIEAGDFVWVHVCTNSIGAWRRTGETSDPGDLRSHSLGSCFAVPGAAPNSKTLAQASTNALVLEAAHIRLGKNASSLAALADKVEQNLNAIKNALSGATAGGNPVTYVAPYVTVISVGATKTKVE